MKKVVTVCPYCASGCKINLVVDNGKIVRLKRRRENQQGTLCLKGYYGWDFINDTQILTPRLKTPMIRRERGGKLEAVSWMRRWITSPLASAPLKPNMARMRSKPPAPPAAPVMKPTM
ncbi:formate dehydrogenase-H [Klebsiella aerogenes]|nr:formate dehydrogenase-H [Klebsiella aerogenes]